MFKKNYNLALQAGEAIKKKDDRDYFVTELNSI